MKKFALIKFTAFVLCLAFLLVGCGEASSADGGMTIYCFSAGKADAFLIHTANGAVLIDTGESGFGKTIVEYCESNGIKKLDYLIITHFDKDHVGGAKKVIESLNIGTVLQSNCPKDSDAYEKYLNALSEKGIEPVTLREDIDFTVDGVSYSVNPPAEESYDDSPSNNSSLITSVGFGEKRFLFAGDAETQRISEFAASSPGKYDFLKVPYHGHWQKALKTLLAETNPAYAVITSSDDEPEDEKTLAALADIGAEVFLTRTAPVKVKCDGAAITVEYDG